MQCNAGEMLAAYMGEMPPLQDRQEALSTKDAAGEYKKGGLSVS